MKKVMFCPVCAKNERISRLELRQINITTAVYLCMDQKCLYPKEHSWIYVERNICDTNTDCSDCESSDSDDFNVDALSSDNCFENGKDLVKIDLETPINSVLDSSSSSDECDSDVTKSVVLNNKKSIFDIPSDSSSNNNHDFGLTVKSVSNDISDLNSTVVSINEKPSSYVSNLENSSCLSNTESTSLSFIQENDCSKSKENLLYSLNLLKKSYVSDITTESTELLKSSIISEPKKTDGERCSQKDVQSPLRVGSRLEFNIKVSIPDLNQDVGNKDDFDIKNMPVIFGDSTEYKQLVNEKDNAPLNCNKPSSSNLSESEPTTPSKVISDPGSVENNSPSTIATNEKIFTTLPKSTTLVSNENDGFFYLDELPNKNLLSEKATNAVLEILNKTENKSKIKICIIRNPKDLPSHLQKSIKIAKMKAKDKLGTSSIMESIKATKHVFEDHFQSVETSSEETPVVSAANKSGAWKKKINLVSSNLKKHKLELPSSKFEGFSFQSVVVKKADIEVKESNKKSVDKNIPLKKIPSEKCLSKTINKKTNNNKTTNNKTVNIKTIKNKIIDKKTKVNEADETAYSMIEDIFTDDPMEVTENCVTDDCQMEEENVDDWLKSFFLT